jgi:hypothetical protein
VLVYLERVMKNIRRKLVDFKLPAGEPEWLSAKRKVPVCYAAGLLNLSEDSFRREHPELIEQLSPRRYGVTLGKVLALCDSLKAAA